MPLQPDMFNRVFDKTGKDTPAELDGRALAEEGAQRAVDHADKVADAMEFGSWSDRAYAILERFAQARVPFRTEQVRQAAYEEGLPVPPDERAWGGVICRAKKEGILRHYGWVSSTGKSSHAHPISLWKGK
jgi:hypothetical protein